jgi:hypothetical protein
MRKLASVLVVLLCTSGCVPSMRHLVEQRRFADAICLASSEGEAREVAQSVWQSVDPKVHVHAVSRQEWSSLLGEERGALADAGYWAIRAGWSHNAISAREVDLSVGVWAPRLVGDELERVDAASYAQRRIAAAATGECTPPQRTSSTTHSWTPAPPRDPLGAILSLFTPSSTTTEVVLDPSDDEYAAAGPAAYALMRALNEGDDAAGFVLRSEERARAEIRMALRVEDELEDGGRCTLSVWKTFVGVDAAFGREYRTAAALPGVTSAWLSNHRGGWRVELSNPVSSRER